MNRLLLILVPSFFAAFQVDAASGVSAISNPWSHDTSAVDTKGIRHFGDEYKGSPPWSLDSIVAVAPAYPFRERNLRHEGTAIVRLTLNVTTGHVVKAILLKSSGYSTLDDCAIAAFSRWVWRPGRWKEIDMSVTFRLSRNPYAPPPRGSFRLPHL
jgi:TonB family protein